MYINLVAPINNVSYGIVSLAILKELIKQGYVVSLFPIGPIGLENVEDKQFVQLGLENAKFFNPDAPSVRIWHQFDHSLFPGRGKRFAFPIFELNKFNDHEKHHLTNVDEILVPSAWAKEVISSNGIKNPTHVVPLAVDTSVFHPLLEKKYKSTIFLNIGKWESRKGHDILLEAFCKAFGPDDNVELWLMTENPFIGSKNEEWKNKYLQSSMGHRVRFFPHLPGQNNMAKEINQADCGVFPTKAEGWCLPALEMMACGKEVIITNYSGQTEFCSTARLVDITGMETANDGVWFDGRGEWSVPNVVTLIKHMQDVHQLKQSGKLQLNVANLEQASKFTWENTVKKLVSVVL